MAAQTTTKSCRTGAPKSGSIIAKPLIWGRGRDSNPRYAFGVHTLSRRAPSTARTPLRDKISIGLQKALKGKPERTHMQWPPPARCIEMAPAAIKVILLQITKHTAPQRPAWPLGQPEQQRCKYRR